MNHDADPRPYLDEVSAPLPEATDAERRRESPPAAHPAEAFLSDDAAPDPGKLPLDQLDRFFQYIAEHPEAIPPRVLTAIGESIVVSLANEASVLGRTEFDQFIKENPHYFLFMRNYADRVGIMCGMRFVPDADLHRAVAEALHDRYARAARPLPRRLWEAYTNKEAGTPISEEVEALYGERMKLQDEVRKLEAKLSQLEAEIDRQRISFRQETRRVSEEQQLRLLKGHRETVETQIARQCQMADELQKAQTMLMDLRRQQSVEVEGHRDRIAALKRQIRELQAERTDAASSSQRNEPEWLQENQAFLDGSKILIFSLISEVTSYFARTKLIDTTYACPLITRLFDSLAEVEERCGPAAMSRTLGVECIARVDSSQAVNAALLTALGQIIRGDLTARMFIERRRERLEKYASRHEEGAETADLLMRVLTVTAAPSSVLA